MKSIAELHKFNIKLHFSQTHPTLHILKARLPNYDLWEYCKSTYLHLRVQVTKDPSMLQDLQALL